MHRTRVIALAPVAVALAVAGCGSSGKSGSTPAASPSSASATPASSSSSAAGGAYGGYGGYGAASTTASTPSATQAALITTKHSSKLGTVLAFGSKKLTVYLFEGDKGASSSCTGSCAAVWPPLTGSPKAIGGAMSADLGTITRPDGTKQVTYKGHPLYLFTRDKDDGDAYGEGLKSFGAQWYALSPAGSKIDKS